MSVAQEQETDRSVPVWDRWVRLSHWLVAAAFVAAYLSAEEIMPLHIWAGYLLGTLLLIRIAWGFLGPEPARFRSFWPTPRRIHAYLNELFRGRALRYLGHNPLGGAMAVALMLSLAVLVGSGLVTLGAEKQSGPLGGFYAGVQEPVQVRLAPLATAHADEDEHEEEEEEEGHHPHAEVAEEVHEAAANITLALIVLHVLGVVLTSWHERQNLVRAMIDGRKRPLE